MEAPRSARILRRKTTRFRGALDGPSGPSPCQRDCAAERRGRLSARHSRMGRKNNTTKTGFVVWSSQLQCMTVSTCARLFLLRGLLRFLGRGLLLRCHVRYPPSFVRMVRFRKSIASDTRRWFEWSIPPGAFSPRRFPTRGHRKPNYFFFLVAFFFAAFFFAFFFAAISTPPPFGYRDHTQAVLS